MWKMGLVALYCSLIRTNRLAKKVNSHEIPIIQLSAHDDASVDGNINDAKKRKYGESEKCAIEREKGELGYIKRTWRENMYHVRALEPCQKEHFLDMRMLSYITFIMILVKK